MSKNIVAIIPARGGSKSVPKKNIRLLGNHPLIAYTIATAMRSELIDDVIVSTDSKEIAGISLEYGASVPFIRPDQISQDHSTDIEFFQHYISFAASRGSIPEILVHLRPTTPFRMVEIVDKAIEFIIKRSNATSLRSVYETQITPYKIFQMSGDYLKGYFPNDEREEYYNLPRQVFPKSFIPNGYVDIVKTSTISNGTLHGQNMLGYITDKVPDIDTLDDFIFAERVLESSQFSHLKDYLKNKYE